LNRVAVALGSNLGKRDEHLRDAVERLRLVLADLRHSTWIETDPVGVSMPQDRFLNGAVTGCTTLPPRTLMDRLLAIERTLGRGRPHANAPRTIDLDLILYGASIIDEPGLRVPHPRFRERRFVLEPLAEIAGDWVDPETGLTVAELRRRVGD
jgi:2-amino-4-hydroxy-6-hydroxymethyldihydropteridine diphosphokinase